MERTFMFGRQTFADLTSKPIWIATFGENAAAAAGVHAAATFYGVGSNKFSPYQKFSPYPGDSFGAICGPLPFHQSTQSAAQP